MKNTPNFLKALCLLLLLTAGCKKTKECPECQNGGSCIDFVCDCPEGYAGDRCQTEKTPLFVEIKAVALLSYPATNNGTAWDDFSQYADPYFKVTQITPGGGGGNAVYYTSPRKDEVSPSVGGIWYQSDLLMSPDYHYSIDFYDFDSGGTDAPIDRITLTSLDVYRAGKGFPIEFAQGNIKLILGYRF